MDSDNQHWETEAWMTRGHPQPLPIAPAQSQVLHQSRDMSDENKKTSDKT